ncbi:unnamed protein product [Echinostoma caproni]|uniref:DUF4209 domain-containing protein n=1 Tax=Echinostoma caproni TaxID=27848 RepID=A0A183AHT0_9TREM|nr:unnamed protein product [Echinostoma caproni]
MKDLLESQELETLLGSNCILVLNLLFGPVRSMNLRNLFWHGFVSPLDIEEMGPEIFHFLFSVVLSIGNGLQQKDYKTSRPSKLPDFIQQQDLANVVNIDPHISLTDVIRTHPVQLISFSAYFEFIDRLFSLDPVPYRDVLCMSLVCLAMLLRYELATAFDWPDGQYTSEERFFVTLDSILELKVLSLIPHIISTSHLEAFATHVNNHMLAVLCDVLSAEHGPRIRDHLSHGELWSDGTIKVENGKCIFECAEQHFKQSALLLKACLLVLLSPTEKSQCDSFGQCQWFASYTLAFHPLAQFETIMSKIQSSLDNLNLLTSDVQHESHFRWSFSTWFPSTERDCSITCKISAIDQLWRMLSAWNLLPGSHAHWSIRPQSVLHRFNLILSKTNDALKKVTEVKCRFSSGDNLSSRQLASKGRFETCFVDVYSYFLWLLQLATLVWMYWLGGAGVTVENKLHLLTSQCLDAKLRGKLILQLDQTSDKLIMWISKSKWEAISSFFEKFPLV